MSVKKTLEAFVGEANKRIREDASLQKTLKAYMGRRIILNIEGQASYLFKISPEGVSLDTKRKLAPKTSDMYITMDKDRGERLIRQKRLRFADLPFIKHRNITIREVKLAKELLRRYLSQPTKERGKKGK